MSTGIQSVLNPQGPAAHSIFTLMTWLFGVCALVYILVLCVAAWAVWHRRREEHDAPRFERRSTRVITIATIATTLILVGFVTATALTEHGLATRQGPGAITVDVIGHQWWWDFQYRNVSPDAWVTSPNELHVPVGVPVVVRMAATDVIHSFWVPNLQGKRDLIPGQVTDTWIQADRPGVYRGQCAEFCGYQHANMSFFVVAEPIGQFEQWIQHQRDEAPPPLTADEQRGRDVFLSSHCVLCHAIRGTSAGSHIGPELTHVASRMTIAAGTLPNTRGHLAGWVVDSQAIKPGNRMPANDLDPGDLQALLTYLRSLR